jgi:RNA polymerase-binding transcription factor DksA
VSVKPSKSAPAKTAPVKTTPTKATATPTKATTAKDAPAKTPASAKSAAVTVKVPPPKVVEAPTSARDKLRSRILAQKTKPAKPVAFSLDEVREVAKTAAKAAPATASAPSHAAAKPAAGKAKLPADSLRAAKPAHIKAASLADILGFNPKQKSSHAASEEATIPDRFKRYYKLLIELRNHVTGQVDQHAEETLKRSAKEDSGDLSSYGTDGGTDSFDRDFALSLVANEQEALAEIEAALQRIKAGTYGVCEHTQQPINKERLIAVPFTRFTAAAMKEVEKTRYKVRGQTGILGEGEEGAKVEDDSGGDE